MSHQGQIKGLIVSHQATVGKFHVDTKKCQFLRGDVKISSLSPKTFHKMLQHHLRGSVTQSVIFTDVS